jgi:ACS family tartrate transporter-like MFS transporter
MGMTSIYGPIYATPFSFLSGPAAAGGVALMTAIGSFGGFVGPTAMGVLRQQTGGYAAGMALLAFGLVVTAATMLLLGRIPAPDSRRSVSIETRDEAGASEPGVVA